MLTPKELKKRFSLCVFDREEGPKTGTGKWQHILELETYVIDMEVISYGILKACNA